MRSAWAFRPGSERHAVPIEMRFIDLFMAALGSLVFMAMLLAFLLRFLPLDGKGGTPEPPHEDGSPSGPLQIVISSFPPAFVGERYEVALAYRGGSGPIAWELPAGTEEIPDGLTFDLQHGILSGVPQASADAHFVVQASDAKGQKDQRPFELVVAPPRSGSKRAEIFLAATVTLLLAWYWWKLWDGNRHSRRMLTEMQKAYKAGNKSIKFLGPDGKTEYIVALPEGMRIHEAQQVTGERKARMVLFVLLLSIAWAVWRIWFS
jgi:Putative Ig domain